MAIVAVQREKKEEKEKTDPLEIIMQGLTIASNVFGIKTADQRSRLLGLQTKQAEQQLASAEQKAALAEENVLTRDDFKKEYIEMKDPEKWRTAFGDIPSTEVTIAAGDERKKVLAVDKDTFKAFRERQKELEARAEKAEERLAQKASKQEKAPKTSAFVAAGYANRAQEANDILDGLERKGFERQSVGTSLKSGFLGSIGEVGELFKGEDLKQYEQAQKSFVNAVLRRESGAVISDAEFDNARKQYFPMAGDTPKVLEQKRRNRLLVINALESEAKGKFVPLPLGTQAVSQAKKDEPASTRQKFTMPKTLMGFAVGSPSRDLMSIENDQDFVSEYLKD